MEQKIRNFIEKELLDDSTVDWDNETDIISSGLIDSLSIVRLLVFLEDTFEINLDDSLELDNFKSVISISNLVRSKLTV